MQTNETDIKAGDKSETTLEKGTSGESKSVSRKKEKLKENLTDDSDENDYGGLPDTGNFKKFLGCGG